METTVLLLAHLKGKKNRSDSRNAYASTHLGATGAVTYGSAETGYTGCGNMMAEVGHKEVRTAAAMLLWQKV